MVTRTYTVELRTDFDDPEKDKIVLEAAREMARTLLATASLLQDRRAPRIGFQCGDMFLGNEDIDIMSEETPGE